MDWILSLINTIIEYVIHQGEAIELMLRGWIDLPANLAVFCAQLGAAGDVLSTVVYLCVGYLMFRLLIMVIELIPGF